MMTTYLVAKQLHIFCVALSLAGFLLRGFWMLTGSVLLHARLSRFLPHVVDSVLLLSALTLMALLGQYPFVAGWLTAKVLGLCGYIVLGTTALKRGRTRRVRAAAFAGAVVLFGWIVSVALSKNPAGFFAWG